ncbi:MAG: HhH-GPD-type base excision DNA repair protein, partial [Acidimicrobiales bacterium]
MPFRRAGPPTLRLAGDPVANTLLATNPLALVIGMVLDQQVPLERAFAAPAELARRLGRDLDAAALATMDPEAFSEAFTRTPALHRYPGSMAARVQAICRVVADEHDGDAARLWDGAEDGRVLRRRLQSLPGFGEQKARIFLALLAKQFGVIPPGWREASAPYGEPGSFRSVADIVDDDSLVKVREFKQAAKQRAKQTA